MTIATEILKCSSRILDIMKQFRINWISPFVIKAFPVKV